MLRKYHTNRYEPGVWQFQDAKAQLSKVMDTVQKTGMQTIIRNRDEVYIVLSKEQYEKYARSKDSLLDFFMDAPCSDIELDITRSQEGIREVDL